MDTQIETRTEYVARRLSEAGHKNWSVIADESGVPEKTLSKIAYKETKDPRDSTVSALVAYFDRQDKKRKSRRTEDKKH